MVFRRHSAGRQPRPGGRLRLSLEFLEDRTVPSTVNWINPAGGDWDTASNWRDAATGANRVPGTTDDAVIGFNGIIVTHASSASDLVHSLMSQGTLSVSKGSLLFAADSSTQGLSLIVGGTVGVLDSADLDVQALLQQTGGTLTGPGTVTSDTLWIWTGGSMAGAGHTVNNGTATLGRGLFLSPALDTRTVDNNGTATLDNVGLSFANLATWNNLPGATLVLGNNSGLGGFPASGQVNNAGLILKQGASPGGASIFVPLDNTGTVDVQVGTLGLSGGLTNEGTYVLEPGTSATISGTVLNGSNSGTFALGSGSRLDLFGTFTILAGAQVDLDPGSQLVINGTVTQQAGAQVTLGAGSVLNVAFGAYILADGAAVDGPGLVELTSSNAQIKVTGAADVSNLYILSGTLNLAAPADLEVQTLAQTGPFSTLTGPGTVVVNGRWTWSGGFMSGAGHTVNKGTATLDSNGFGIGLDSRTVDNAGTATVNDNSRLGFLDLATWNNLPGATLVLGNGASLGSLFGGSSGQLNNYGLLQDSGPTGNAAIAFAVLNSGTVSLQGFLDVSGSYTQTADGTFVTNLGPGSPPTAGRLIVFGPAALDGTLAVKTLPGFSPIAGQNFLILTFSSLVGDFATFTGLDLGGGLDLDPIHSNTNYTLAVSAA
jgi:hypothetical protein